MAFLRELFQKNASTLLSMFLLVALPVLGSSTLSYMLYRNQALLEHLTLGQSLVYFGIIAFTMAFAITPTTFVALVTGFYLGWAGLPGMVLAYALASLAGYQVAASLDHGKMLQFLHHFPKADAVMRELKQDSWQLIILTRISPVLPFALMTFVLAVMRVDRRRFLLASVVGMLPRSLFFYWLGTKAQDVFALLKDPDTGTAGKLLVIALVAISLFGLYFLFNRALKRALGGNSTNKQ
ncbi:VTT domain-containing protein [Hymenobacter tibetensis]|uniref:TVP38/TMEM64 family membrane protein n=1 Tax=Hymenobacter tibetensis TaxID=497967 RepID=A0ABY4CV34_9BACT|nr:VTT domain-containing protein [Hymenobacter tibetensis]UOG74053.1 VTT domain-containing protein [Hymenobacter tibetensis]